MAYAHVPFVSTVSQAISECHRKDTTFNEVALNDSASDTVVLVDFYADWCGPCKVISPILEKLIREDVSIKTGSGRFLDLVMVDTDKEPKLAQKYRIRSLPTVMAFKDGKPINHFIGALKEEGVSSCNNYRRTSVLVARSF